MYNDYNKNFMFFFKYYVNIYLNKIKYNLFLIICFRYFYLVILLLVILILYFIIRYLIKSSYYFK